MANAYTGTELSQPPTGRIARQVGTGHGIAKIQQHLGDATHTGAADANEVYVFNLVFHVSGASPSAPASPPVKERSATTLLGQRNVCV
jgi:hypothetical protein